MIKISIITVCYNSPFLEECIKSVLDQTYGNLEYIIVDGGSTDGTLEVIEKYKNQISKWISEKDSGISEAMNKGLKRATGDYIYFLHSDDYLLSERSIEKAVKAMDFSKDINAFSVLYGQPGNFRKMNSKPFGPLTYFKTNFMHQGVFCHRRVFRKIGGFDESIKITMDYDFFLRACINNINEAVFHMPVAFMRDTGISSQKDWVNLLKRFEDEKKIHYKNCNNRKLQIIYNTYWVIYFPYRRLVYLLNSR